MRLDTAQAETIVRDSELVAALGARAGAVVTVIRGNQAQVITLGCGVDSATPVQIASVTKAFTGILLADAIQRGELMLESKLDDVLFAERWPGSEAISASLLVTQQSGLPRLWLRPWERLSHDPYRWYSRENLMAYLRRKAPRVPEKLKYRYSNLGFAALGLMLEKACGKSYAELLRMRILSPLGLHHTQLALSGEKVPVKRGYARFGKTPPWLWPRPPVWHCDAYAPCGALISTAEDLIRFAQLLLDESSSIADAFRFSCEPQAIIAGGAIGLAWHLPASKRFVWHNGSTYGHSAYVAIAPQFGVAVIAVANQPLAMQLTQLGHGLMKQALS